MSHEPGHCPKCDGQMERGFILDFAYGGNFVSRWSQGTPRKSFWSVTKLSNEEAVPIGVYRCLGCGFLESYARFEFDVK